MTVEVQRTAAYDDAAIGLNIRIQRIVTLADDNIRMEPGFLVHLGQICLTVGVADGRGDRLYTGISDHGGVKDPHNVIVIRQSLLLVVLQIIPDRGFQVLHTGDDPLIVRIRHTGPELVQRALTIVLLDKFLIAVRALQIELVQHLIPGDKPSGIALVRAGNKGGRIGQHPVFQQRLQLKQRVQLIIVLHGLIAIVQR